MYILLIKRLFQMNFYFLRYMSTKNVRYREILLVENRVQKLMFINIYIKHILYYYIVICLTNYEPSYYTFITCYMLCLP